MKKESTEGKEERREGERREGERREGERREKIGEKIQVKSTTFNHI